MSLSLGRHTTRRRGRSRGEGSVRT
jgi:hypothetical protein